MIRLCNDNGCYIILTMQYHSPPPLLLSADEAQAILDPHIDDLRACLSAGWRAWQALCEAIPVARVRTSNRTRAGIVYDAAVAEARMRFLNKPGVHLMSRLGFLVVVFDGRLVLRFKKYRHGLRTGGIPTHQQLSFAWQAEMDGMPPAATKVVAGYLLNRLQDGIARMAITCSVGPNLRWCFDIADAAAAAASPTPMPAPSHAGGPSPPVVRIARTEEQRADEAE